MTPEFASPEQVRGEQITTASDVYSLGIVLYRLMTGHAPYVLSRSGPVLWSRIILEAEPERPSLIVEQPSEVSGPQSSTKPVTPEEIALARATRLSALRAACAATSTTLC